MIVSESCNFVWKRLIASMTLVFTMSLVLGCTLPMNTINQKQKIEDSTNGLILTAEIIPEKSTVIFPSERFSVQGNEGSILMTAELIEYSKCMQSNGISWVAQDLTKSYEPESEMFYEFGPWTEDMANRFGSVQPMSQDALFANGFITSKPDGYDSRHRENPNTLIPTTASFIGISNGCNKKVESMKTSYTYLLKTKPKVFDNLSISNISTIFAKNSKFIAIKTDLKNCYRREGLSFEDSDSPLGFHIKGASTSVINVTQIHLALQDVKCKTRTHTIERIADLWANYEAPFIEKNSAELQAYRASIDKALSQAKGVIEENTDVLWK